MRTPRSKIEFEALFWSLVEKTSDCWVWRGGFDSRGYGRIYRNGKRRGTHRISYEMANGPITNGLFVCHHCDNRPCVKPDHLFLGTHIDNMQDSVKKGRNSFKTKNPAPRGDAHWTRHNTEKAKLELRKISEQRKAEWRTGRRSAVRDAKGRIIGTRMAPQ